MRNLGHQILATVIWTGNLLTIFGCLSLLLGLAGVFNLEVFAYGLSSGIRIVGSLAIAGCLLSAISYGVLDFSKK
ncbi:hypothetical protein CBI30_06815 [Polynucleobacter aenigmaticus]|jgi:hypothetical protein|uniref:Uncharacterized protein n=2 Tax=Polynucleobacter TaxID=44013 RepID=A0A254Q1N1_9BURK|nr:hypothetical protein CBI30_06815 [Polynucleobacter aenigmaticus]